MMYGKYWERANNRWVEITKDRFEMTILPAVYIPGHSDQRLRIKNLINIAIEQDIFRHYHLTKTFVCGRKYTWVEDKYTNLLGLIDTAMQFDNFEDIELKKITKEKEWYKEQYENSVKKIEELSNKIDYYQNKINDLVNKLDNIKSINMKGGTGSRKEVDSIISELIVYEYNEENDTYPVLR